MSVWKDRAGRYHAAIERNRKRLHRVCPPAATWRDAKRLEADLLRLVTATAAPVALIGDAIARWLVEDVAHQRARERTESNAYALAEWVEGRPLTDVVAVANEYIRAHRGRLTNSTINRRLAVLKRVANLAWRRWGWLPDPLAGKIELLPENAARERYLSRQELAQLLLGIRDRAIRRAVLVASFTGLRRGELARLRPVNVQGDLIYLRQTKSGHSRTVPVVHHVRFALLRLPFGPHADTLTHAVPAAMPGVRFHDLRHTCASLLLKAGVDLYRIGAILGHSDIRTTRRYAHLAVDNLRDAIGSLGRNHTSVALAANAKKRGKAA